jgi:hypothetical protein
MFGSWIYNIEELQSTFINALPFEHTVIDDFLSNEYANDLHELFPEKFDDWYIYENPIEYKFTYNNIILSGGTFSWLIGFLTEPNSNIYYPEIPFENTWYGDIFIFNNWNKVII